MQKINLSFFTLIIACSFLGSGCYRGETKSVNQSLSLPVESSTTSPVVAPELHGIEYTSEEAGISLDHEEQQETLAYLRAIEERDGKLYATIDPVHFFDCGKLASLHKKLPTGCLDHPEVGFSIENTDLKTVTYEMATSSGPFFLNRIDGVTNKQWRTMDLPTIQGLLEGTISTSDLRGYYDATVRDNPTYGVPANLFFIIEKNGIIQKIIEKYRA